MHTHTHTHTQVSILTGSVASALPMYLLQHHGKQVPLGALLKEQTWWVGGGTLRCVHS